MPLELVSWFLKVVKMGQILVTSCRNYTCWTRLSFAARENLVTLWPGRRPEEGYVIANYLIIIMLIPLLHSGSATFCSEMLCSVPYLLGLKRPVFLLHPPFLHDHADCWQQHYGWHCDGPRVVSRTLRKSFRMAPPLFHSKQNLIYRIEWYILFCNNEWKSGGAIRKVIHWRN